MSALDKQIGGDHYKKMKIQTTEFCMANNLDHCQSNIIKYVCRYEDKGGERDLDKAMHYIQLLIHFKYGEGKDNETCEVPTVPFRTAGEHVLRHVPNHDGPHIERVAENTAPSQGSRHGNRGAT